MEPEAVTVLTSHLVLREFLCVLLKKGRLGLPRRVLQVPPALIEQSLQ